MGRFYDQMQIVTTENKSDEYIDIELMEDIKAYVEFLDDIPDKDIDEVATMLIQLLVEYMSDFAPLINKHSSKDNNKGQSTRKINADVKTIQKALDKIEDITTYPLSMSDSLKVTHKYLKSLIRELEAKEFKEVSRERYYKYKEKTKQPIKDFLMEVTKKYSIKSPIKNINEFITIIQKY